MLSHKEKVFYFFLHDWSGKDRAQRGATDVEATGDLGL
jgi:hypothetical protein